MIMFRLVTLTLGLSLTAGAMLGNLLVPHQTSDVKTVTFYRADKPFVNPNQTGD